MIGRVRSAAVRRCLEQPALVCPEDRGPAARHVQLGEEVPGVRAYRVVGDEQLAGNLWAGEFAVEQSQHLHLPIGQRVHQRLVWCRPIGLGQEAGRVRVGHAEPLGSAQQGLHGVAFIEEEACITVWVGSCRERPSQGLQGLRPVVLCVEDQGREHVDLDDAAPTPDAAGRLQ